MREDMQYISGVLDELEAIVQDASGVPMRKGLAVVDRSDLLVMLDELRASLPRELAEAEALRRECGVMVASAEEEGRRKRLLAAPRCTGTGLWASLRTGFRILSSRWKSPGRS